MLADPVVAGDGSTAHESHAQPNQESRYNHEEENVIPIYKHLDFGLGPSQPYNELYVYRFFMVHFSMVQG